MAPKKRVIGLLPAAGLASRMMGIPKFLLPLSETEGTLLSHHITLMERVVERILIPTRREWIGVLNNFGLGEKVSIIEKNTETLTQSVLETLDSEVFDEVIIGLPDTYFSRGNPYASLSQVERERELLLACFSTQSHQEGRLGSVKLEASGLVTQHVDKPTDSEFGTHWGAMRLPKGLLGLLPADSATVGALIDECLSSQIPVLGVMETSEFFDCGTVDEYTKCLVAIRDGDNR